MKSLATSGWIGLGGFLGANARYWLSGWAAARCGAGFPWGTLLVNVSGAFALGLVMGLATERLELPPQIRSFVAIGFLGAYTTFSTYEYESLALAEAGSWLRAAGNLVGSVLLGFLAVWLGLRLGRAVG